MKIATFLGRKAAQRLLQRRLKRIAASTSFAVRF
jgi:hypothetical protein